MIYDEFWFMSMQLSSFKKILQIYSLSVQENAQISNN